MLYLDDIKVEFESQGFKGTHIGISPNKDKSVLFLESVRSMQSVRCPYCGGSDEHERILQQAYNKAQIVYDRFHIQSQFGRDVLGVVRLDETRRHKAKEKEILVDISNDTDKDTVKSLKQEAKSEKQGYSQLKKLRWSLFINSDKLSDSKTEQLQSIQQDQYDLAVCYAMKEEMCRLYELTDYQQAVIGWTKWFQAAKESEIPALVRFAVQKEKRLPGLAAHAIYSISTGKLEGFNNKLNICHETNRLRLPR